MKSRRKTACLVGCALVLVVASSSGAQTTIFDRVDASPRLTDIGHNGPYQHAGLVLPDVIEVRWGNFTPITPHLDRFTGNYTPNGGYLRCDIVFKGLVNPPGPIDLDLNNQEYDPLRFGPSPVCGFIEFNMDNNMDTGGELDFPDLRYTGMSGRFGGRSMEPRFRGRLARDMYDNDHDVTTPPFIDRSGEEFHIAFYGEHIKGITVQVEKPNGQPGIFETGEVWIVSGTMFHRAHGFEDFAFQCTDSNGYYMPDVQLRWGHDISTDKTTVSLVYPLTNSASAALIGPNEPVEPNDGCTSDQNSIDEALRELKFCAQYPKPGDVEDPDFQLLAGWANENVSNFLDSANYWVVLNVGTFYPQKVDGATYVWTDVWPEVRPGDFDGDGCIGQGDTLELTNYINDRDGLPGVDDDGIENGIVTLGIYSENFSMFDSDQSSTVNSQDEIVLGDMDLNHQLNFDDVDDLVESLLSPEGYESSHNGAKPWHHGDFTCDLKVDGSDLQPFLDALLGIQ